MKKALQLSILIINGAILCAWGADNNDRIAWIKQEYKTIRENLDKYQKQKLDFLGESTEGAHAVAYAPNKGEIKLIEVTYCGEMGKTEYEFYYSSNTTFFIFEKDYSYNTHIMMTEEMAKERSEEEGVKYEAFDSAKTKLEEWRYYFDGDKAIKTIDPQNKEVTDPKKSGNALEASQKNLARFGKT